MTVLFYVFQVLCIVFCQCVKIVCVCIEKEAREQAVSPAWVCKYTILVVVEDLHPHLIFWVQGHNSGPRCYVMVPRVGIERFDAILTILYQGNGQVFVGQCNVIGEIINAWVCTDELARLRVVVSALIKQDLVELDGDVLCGVAAGDSRRECRFRQQAATLAGSCSSTWPSFAFLPFLSVAAYSAKWAHISVLSCRASFPRRAAIASVSDLTCRANSAL